MAQRWHRAGAAMPLNRQKKKPRVLTRGFVAASAVSGARYQNL